MYKIGQKFKCTLPSGEVFICQVDEVVEKTEAVDSHYIFKLIEGEHAGKYSVLFVGEIDDNMVQID